MDCCTIANSCVWAFVAALSALFGAIVAYMKARQAELTTAALAQKANDYKNVGVAK